MDETQQPSERWSRLWALFEELVDAAPEERPARLRDIGSRDPDLRREVEELLAADEAGLSILDRSPIALDAQKSSHSLEPRTLLADRFEIVRVIGAGGGGEVYEAIDHELGRRVAVKSLHTGGDEDSTIRKRFLQEIRLAQQVTHRNVCRVFDLVRDGSRSFVSIDACTGSVARRSNRSTRACPRSRRSAPT